MDKPKTLMACNDCHEKREVDAKERYSAGRVACHACGGTMARLNEVAGIDAKTARQAFERSKPADDKFPKHELVEQPDGTWKSKPLTFHASRWKHLN